MGYCKDLLAFVIFAMLLFVVVQSHVLISREWLQICLLMALLLDGMYTLCPGMHNTSFAEASTSMITAQILVLIIGIACAWRVRSTPIFLHERGQCTVIGP